MVSLFSKIAFDIVIIVYARFKKLKYSKNGDVKKANLVKSFTQKSVHDAFNQLRAMEDAEPFRAFALLLMLRSIFCEILTVYQQVEKHAIFSLKFLCTSHCKFKG